MFVHQGHHSLLYLIALKKGMINLCHYIDKGVANTIHIVMFHECKIFRQCYAYFIFNPGTSSMLFFVARFGNFVKQIIAAMSLKTQIDQDIKKAMLAKNKEELDALRGIKSMILLAETEKGSATEISADTEIRLLTKAAKQRKESADIFSKEGRTDLAQKENFQLEIIARYLPKQLTEAELTNEINAIIQQTGAKGPQDLGKVMGVASKMLAGKADGKAISDVVKKILAA